MQMITDAVYAMNIFKMWEGAQDSGRLPDLHKNSVFLGKPRSGFTFKVGQVHNVHILGGYRIFSKKLF